MRLTSITIETASLIDYIYSSKLEDEQDRKNQKDVDQLLNN